jgi:hypothetical protein
MKSTALLLSTAALLGLASCDQAKDAASKAQSAASAAAEGAKASATDLAADAKASAADLAADAKATAVKATEAATAAGAEALDKTKELTASALDWTTEKLGIPQADGLLDSFKSLFAEAKTAASGGLTGDKATALKAKWDTLSSQAAETIKGLAPEQQEKLSQILSLMKSKWDELMAKPADGAAK